MPKIARTRNTSLRDATEALPPGPLNETDGRIGPVADGDSDRPCAAESQSPLFAVDFFCGAGGMTEGLKQAGIRVSAGVDIDPSVRATYEANHGSSTAFKELDVRKCAGEEVLKWLPTNTNPDDVVLVGCSPCQFWSRMPSSKTRSLEGSLLLYEFSRIIAEVRPGYVVIENVPGLMKAGKDTVLRPFTTRLAELGYTAVIYRKVYSAWFGVPQMRPRLVLLASRLHTSINLPPHDKSLRPTVRQFIGPDNGFSALAAGQKDDNDVWHRAAALSSENLERIALTHHDGGDRSAWSDTTLQLETYKHRKGFANVYGRMWRDRPAATLTTRFNSLSNGRFGHPSEDRAISIREGATLQTFPKHYAFIGGSPTVCKQIGNAVPPALAKALGQHLLELHAARQERAMPLLAPLT